MDENKENKLEMDAEFVAVLVKKISHQIFGVDPSEAERLSNAANLFFVEGAHYGAGLAEMQQKPSQKLAAVK